MVQFFREHAALSIADELGYVDVSSQCITRTLGGSIRWPDAVARGIEAAKQGVRRAIVTFPNTVKRTVRTSENTWQESMIACQRLEKKLAGFGHSIELIPQIEFDVCRQLFSDIETAYCVAGGLHRTSVRLRVGGQGVNGLLPIVRQIKRMDLVPVLVGVDESISFHRPLSGIADLRAEGARVILSVDGIFDRHHPMRRKFCRQTVSAGQCDLIGGGSHQQSIADAVRWLLRIDGDRRAQQIFAHNANAVCDSHPKEMPSQQSSPWRLGNLLRRAP